jgi:hypothetical protein
MKIACICSTFNRPQCLAESIECFQRQTCPLEKRELIILDDAGQYAEQTGPGWWLLSIGKRFRTLGEKRNATAALVSADVDALAVWDDDDIYLPWHLEKAAELLSSPKGVGWSRPEVVWNDHPKMLKRKSTGGLFHGAWVFTREAFVRAHGYPAMQSGQDQGLAKRFRRAGVLSGSPASPPSFVHRWGTSPAMQHLSALGPRGYERRGGEKIVRQPPIVPAWSKDWEAKARAAIRAAAAQRQ